MESGTPWLPRQKWMLLCSMEGLGLDLDPSQHNSFGLQQQEVMESLGHRQQRDEGMAFAPKICPDGGAAQVLQAPGCARQPKKGFIERLVLLQREGQHCHHPPGLGLFPIPKEAGGVLG